MLFLRNFTDPSTNRKLVPPGCMLTKPLAAAEKRQPAGASTPWKLRKQLGSEAENVFEFQPRGIVVPAVAPLLSQKLLSAAREGITSPTMKVLPVPSGTPASPTVWSVR